MTDRRTELLDVVTTAIATTIDEDTDSITAVVDALLAAESVRVAELEAKVARVEALADQWSFPVSLSHDDHWYASRLRAALAGESDE